MMQIMKVFRWLFCILQECLPKYWYLFFLEMKRKSGDLHPNVFMSDDDAALYNAFKSVFGEAKNQLLCTWHVKRAWKLKLNQKIKDENMREAVCQELFSLHSETDSLEFEKKRKLFVENLLKEEITRAFGEYINSYYMCQTKLWAYCYRLGLRINTNMKVERWHREIKYEEADGKIIKCLDKSLCIVLNVINRKLIGRFISMEQSKLTSLHANIRSRHNAALEIPKGNIYPLNSGKEWSVVFSKASTSSHSLETYHVQKENDCECDINCDDCKICIHNFSCTCIDYKIKFVICKHIHLVNIHYPLSAIPYHNNHIYDKKDQQYNNNLIDLDEKQHRRNEEKEAIAEQLYGKKDTTEELRMKAHNIFASLAAKCLESNTSNQELNILIKHEEKIQARLAALHTTVNLPFVDQKVSSLKNVTPQRRFYSSKKRKVSDITPTSSSCKINRQKICSSKKGSVSSSPFQPSCTNPIPENDFV